MNKNDKAGDGIRTHDVLLGKLAGGMLQVRQYNGKHGMSVAIELKNVRELRVYDRDGELEKVLSSEKAKVE